ncbi:MAG TPA: gamma-glutamyl-gamma-aminobutyrate hydrolase family protein [Candidatus Bathyarchaeia archaeon]|nr:gamma-glutamyl-gamma-aminobutyrate hydrolase family protein [Candidatus Bathyarchaeia archaeon]
MKIVVVNNYKELGQTEKAVQNIEKCAGQSVEKIDFNEQDLYSRVVESGPDLVILTGSSALLSKPRTRELFQPEMDLVRKAKFPVLGICYGHQIIGSAFGAPMRDLGQMLRGYEKVNVVRKHPLFDGLPSDLVVAESHRQELIKVPDEFQHLAQSTTTRVEAIVHRSKPIYGVQFHPERSNDDHPHGRMIIQNLVKQIRRF